MSQLNMKQAQPYLVVLCVFLIFTVFSLAQQSFTEIFNGVISVNMTRGVLITDYIEIGGIGGALMNGVLVGTISVIFIIRNGITPTGSTIMAIFLSLGFALFGKNLMNMVPLTFGVWLYSRAVKRPFSDFYVAALLSASISPISSELMFLDVSYVPVNMVLGILFGTLAGFLFPMISEYLGRVTGGFNLYNMGFTGGMLATIFCSLMVSMGIEITPAYYVSGGNNAVLAALLYSTALFLILCGMLLGDRKRLVADLESITKVSGRMPCDFFSEFGANIYVNMGMLCILGTTLVLLIGAQLNGPSIAGILTMTGFGAMGKHIKNVFPVIVGAVVASYVNLWDPTDPMNVLTILFCTGLAPIAGQYGVLWGVLAGFLHVGIAHHVGYLSSGLNLYGNGFAAGFVVLMLVPVIDGVRKIIHNK